MSYKVTTEAILFDYFTLGEIAIWDPTQVENKEKVTNQLKSNIQVWLNEIEEALKGALKRDAQFKALMEENNFVLERTAPGGIRVWKSKDSKVGGLTFF